jgi:hypothetical protein
MTKAQVDTIMSGMSGVTTRGINRARVAFNNHPGGPPHQNDTVIINTVIVKHKSNGKSMNATNLVTDLGDYTSNSSNFLGNTARYTLDYNETTKTLTIEPK